MSNGQFVNGKELFRLICEYQDTGDKKVYLNIIENYTEMIRRYLMKHQFNKYDDMRKSEMKSIALYNFCKQGHKFNRERSQNPFAYYTQMIKNSIYQALNEHNDKEQFESSIPYIEQFDAPSDFRTEFVEPDGDYEERPVSSNLYDENLAAKLKMINSFKNNKVFTIFELERFTVLEKQYYTYVYNRDADEDLNVLLRERSGLRVKKEEDINIFE
jgi:hypothetical protein